MRCDDDEPVFKKSPWGTARYVYNPRHPVGLALIVMSVVVGGIVLLLMQLRAGPFAPPPDAVLPSWSSTTEPTDLAPWVPPVDTSPPTRIPTPAESDAPPSGGG
ncbi:hypothetical protein [Streptomyces sp. NPDC088789]|uniref:hypothetical protein n=1 Tax=Streptomyces sp. NPDC088789 TaxID=3365899 RepID=UPI003812291B